MIGYIKGNLISHSNGTVMLETGGIGYEILCSAEAYEIYGEKTNEIDVTDKSIEEIRDMMIDILCDNLECPIGNIDFMDWFLR